jgi:hypothetical protein
MNNENNTNLPAELAALDARFAELGAAERAAAPAGVESRILAATAPVVVARVVIPARKEPVGVIGRLSIRRLDWPMRAAAVIAVMIGGWAVINGVNGPRTGSGPGPGPAPLDPEKLANFVFNSGPSEQLQRLLLETAKLETLMGDDDLNGPDGGDLETM